MQNTRTHTHCVPVPAPRASFVPGPCPTALLKLNASIPKQAHTLLHKDGKGELKDMTVGV